MAEPLSSDIKLAEGERANIERKTDWENKLKIYETKKLELQQELSSTASGHHMKQLQGELENVERDITGCVSMVQDCEKWVQDNESRIVEIRGEAEKRQRKEDSAHLFDEAIKDGYVKLKINNVLLSGVAGSGKTNLKLLLTNKPPSQQRNSTPCMEKPVRLNIRPVSTSTFSSTGRGWVEISDKKLLSLLAQIIAKHPKRSHPQAVGAKVTEVLKEITTPVANSKSPQLKDTHSLPQSQAVIDKTINGAIDSIVSEVAQELTGQQCEPIPLEHKGGEQFDSTWVYISDCGGQPQFHDVSPLFIRHISVALIVLRLIDSFSSFPLDEYFKDGELMGLPHASHMTLGETLKNLIRSIESHSSQEKKPNLMFVGTFLDQIVNTMTVDEKNQEVLDIMSADMKKQVKYNGNLKRPIFAMNTLSREEAALDIADKIREAIEACHPLEIEVPVWWFFLDFNLQKLTVQLGRGVLSKQECFQLAVRFGFGINDVEAALVFFDKMCIAHYYPAILPDTVFVNAQIPLDKITELTEHAIALRTSEPLGLIDGKLKQFTDEGVITLDFLQMEQFNKHYVAGIFSPKDMLLIMKELLVIAPIPLVSESDCKSEYFMPSLLKSIPPAELEEYRNSSENIDPIAIYFPTGCIRSGVFCCLIVYLIKVHNWKVLFPSGDPVLLAKNCVKFRIPDLTCTITLIDSFSWIEVYVNAPYSFNKKLCPRFRRQLLKGVRAAYDILHYKYDTPQVSIFCSCESTVENKEKRHLAEVNKDGHWTCSLQADFWGELHSQQKIWFSRFSELTVPPCLKSDDPKSIRVKQSNDATLTVQAEGTDLTYQWLKDGIPLRGDSEHYCGVNTPALTIRQASQVHSGEYRCMVENDDCEESVTSSPNSVKVVEPPSVNSIHPPRSQIKRDNSISLGVEGKGEDLVYQWFKDGFPLSKDQDLYRGVTSPTLSICRASLEHKGEYHCVVSNEEGQVNSQLHELSVFEPPHFKLDKLRSKKVKSNESISLTVKAGGTDLIYQWFKDGEPLRQNQDHYRGVTTSTLFINKVSLQDKGEYHCVISNEGGEVHSQPWIITIVVPPSLKQELTQKDEIKNLTLTVQTERTDLNYQWLRDGAPIKSEHDHYHGMTTPSLIISQASMQHSAEYQCVVENEEGTSFCPFRITVDSNSSRDMKVKEGSSVKLSAQAEGIDLTYQWFKDGNSLRDGQDHFRGVTTPTLYISRASLLHKGEYHCVVSSEGGEMLSRPQTLSVHVAEKSWKSSICSMLVLVLLQCIFALVMVLVGMLFPFSFTVCEKLPSLENGQVVYIPGGHSLTHGTLAVHDCDEGFVLNGDPIRICVAGDSTLQGIWTSQPRLCLRATAGGDDSKNIHTVKSVQDLMKMLSDIGNWETLCTLLGVNQGVMSELKFTSLDTNIKKKRCLESYFDSGHAHWEEVIKAVVGPGILNARVAKEIAYKYLLDHRDILSKHEL